MHRLVGHSRGGFIVRYALNDFQSRIVIYKAVLLASPMYGSDIALGPNSLLGFVPLYKNTSENNLKMLRPGSLFVKNMNSWLGTDKCLCIADTGAPPVLTARWGVIPYDRGLGHSDGAVPASSALLAGAAGNITLARDHGTAGLATYTPDDKYPIDPSPGLSARNIPDPCTGRRNKPDMFADELYKAVREFIK